MEASRDASIKKRKKKKMKEINIKTKMPNWLQVVLYWLMVITDGIFIGAVITKGFDVNPYFGIIGLIVCLIGSPVCFNLPYIKEGRHETITTPDGTTFEA